MLACLAAALLLHVLLLLRLPVNSATALQAKPELVMDTFMLAPATAAAPAPTLTPVPEEAVAPKPIVQPIEPEAVPVRPQRPKPKKKTIERRVAVEQPIKEAVVERPPTAAPATASSSPAPVAPAAPVLVTKPKFLMPPSQPVYPPVAQRRGQQGTVWLEILLSESGKQLKLSITRSSGVESLDNAAKVAVADWKFAPYRMNGMAVSSRVQVPVEFVIQ